MSFTFKHPKYYKELRKRNKSDQAISYDDSTECSDKRAPGQGPKPQAPSESSNKLPDTFTLIKFYRDRSQGLY